jgi:hypothetical protein
MADIAAMFISQAVLASSNKITRVRVIIMPTLVLNLTPAHL